MKKVLFVVVSLLLVSYCFALESAPSNKVGYVKLSVAGGSGFAYTRFGLPFVFWDVPTGNVPTYGTESRKVSDVFGTQPLCLATANGPDRIIRSDGKTGQRQGTGCPWVGALETDAASMAPGYAYQVRTNAQTAKVFILAGEADTTAVGIPVRSVPGGTVSAPGYCQYSWRDPRDVDVSKLNLMAQGFLGGANANASDRVSDPAGPYVWYKTTAPIGWTYSGMTTVTPGKAYYIVNKHATGWNYTYNASGAAIVGAGSKDGDATLQKVTAPSVTKTAPAVKAETRAKK